MTNDTVIRAQEIIALQAERTQLKTMADYVREHLINLCSEDPDFVGRVNDTEKSFMDCIAYIKKKACEWLKEQAKIELSSYAQGVGGDVPNDICYQWAIEYYYSKPEPKPEIKKNDKAAGKPKGKSGKKSAAAEKSGTQMELGGISDKSKTAEPISLFDEEEEAKETAEDKTDTDSEDIDDLFHEDEDDIEGIDFEPSDYEEAV